MERAGSGAQWRNDEFDQVHGIRLVRATKLDVPGQSAARPGTLQGSVPSMDLNRDGPRGSGRDWLLQAVTATSPAGEVEAMLLV